MHYTEHIEWSLKIEQEFPESQFSVEDADEGDIGYYAWVDGGYLGDCYQSWDEALEAIYKHLKGE